MSDLRDLLSEEGRRLRLPVGAAERMWGRGQRRERHRRLAAIGLSAVVLVAILVLLGAGWLGEQSRKPAEPVPVTPRSLAGVYAVDLVPGDPGVGLLHAEGRYQMRLSSDGGLELLSPRPFDLPGNRFTFQISEGELTTDALVGSECEAPGTYRVNVEARELTLVPIEESCELRRIVFASHPWSAIVGPTTPDPLEGEWITTFSCEQMVLTVRRARVTPEREAFWTAVQADQWASEDLTDPCKAVSRLSWMLRFADGRLQVFDPPDLLEGFDGRYDIRGDVVEISDGRDRNIDGRYDVAFRIEGDRVVFDLIGRGASDPFFIAVWETAEFVRQP